LIATRIAAALVFFLAALPVAVRAGDFGPRHDVAHIRSDARRLLAQRVRATGVDPKDISISDVVVVKDQALLSWDSGKQHAIMGLVRYLDRWWDALDASRGQGNAPCWRVSTVFPLDAKDRINLPLFKMLSEAGMAAALQEAAKYNADIANPLATQPPRGVCDTWGGAIYDSPGIGTRLDPPSSSTAGYKLDVVLSQNDASKNTKFTRIYGRAPTQAEMLPNPAPARGWGGPTDVFYFDLAISGNKPVTFQPGTKLDIWFPFVLDDTLSYRVSWVMDGQFSKSIHGTVFDNVLHFELPAFSIAPPNELQAEVEGFW